MSFEFVGTYQADVLMEVYWDQGRCAFVDVEASRVEDAREGERNMDVFLRATVTELDVSACDFDSSNRLLSVGGYEVNVR